MPLSEDEQRPARRDRACLAAPDGHRWCGGADRVRPGPGELRRDAPATFWEFEDGHVNLDALRGGNPAQAVLATFAHQYANDWFLFPLDLASGICTLTTLGVVDTFGTQTVIRAVAELDHPAKYLPQLLMSVSECSAREEDRRQSMSNQTETEEPPTIFISHTHSDEGLAQAWQRLIADLFADAYVVRYSTSKDPGSGLAPGEQWVRWISDNVRAASVALVLLTPTSVQKPWVLWEAGALEGVAIAKDSVSPRRTIRPIVYQLTAVDVPDPFRRLQLVQGDEERDVALLVKDLLEQHPSMPRSKLLQIGERLALRVRQHVMEVDGLMLTSPLLPTEAAVEEWCTRLDELAQAGRASEVRNLHQWMDIAFGQNDADRRPIDLRLHRRLGELYLSTEQFGRAAEQFELARQLSRRDIYILRSLGQAYLEAKKSNEAATVINRIDDLDPTAADKNVECAALKGRWLRQGGDLLAATQVYRTALASNPDSYYLADVLGQILLELNDIDSARSTYSRTLTMINRLTDDSLWLHATAANAAIATGDLSLASRHLQAAGRLRPTSDEIATIERGLRTLQSAFAISEVTASTWRHDLSRPLKD